MKNFISAITIFLLFSTGYLSAQVTEVNLEMPRDSVGLPGDTIRIPVILNTDLTGEDIISFRLEFSYPNSIKPIGTSVEGTLIESWGDLTINESDPGRIVTSAAGVSPIAGDSAVLFYMDFELLGENTNSYIYLYTSTGANNYFNENDYTINMPYGMIRIDAIPKLNVSMSTTVARGDSLNIYVSGGTVPYSYSVSDPALAEIVSGNYLKALNPGLVTVLVEDQNGVQGTSPEIDLLGFKLTFPELTNINPGDTVLVPLLVSDLAGLDVVSGNFNIEWTEINSLELVTANSLLENASVEVNPASSTENRYAFATTQPISGSDTLAYFKVITSLDNNGNTIYLRPRGMFFNENLSGNYDDGYVRLNTLTVVNISGSLGTQLVPGNTVQLSVTGGTEPYTWSSSAPDVASVNSTGLVTIHKGGQFQITVEDAFGQTKTSATITAYDGTIEVATDVAVVGQQYDLPVYISQMPAGRNYSSFSLNTTFDSSKLEFQSIVKAGTLSENFTYSHNNKGNKVLIAAASTDQVSVQGVLFYLRFLLKESVTTTSAIPVYLNDVLFNEGAPNLIVKSGSVTPGDAPPVAGNSEITLNEDETHVFATTDFVYSQSQDKAFARFKVLTLPETGILTLSGATVLANQEINISNIANLVYTPEPDTNGIALTYFNVKVGDATYLSNNTGTVTINITSVNDAPEFTLPGNVFLETNFADTTIVVIPGSVPEDEKTQSITYSMAPSSIDFANVSIDATTGDITITAIADAAGTQLFTVTANDGQAANNIVEKTFTLTITAPNSAPVITDQSFDVEENRPYGTSIGNVVASDADGDALNFTIISGNEANNFIMDAATGELLVNEGATLDFETLALYTLTVQVFDGEALTSATISINILDVAGNEAPVINAQSFSISGNSANGTVVGTATASDPEGSTLAYSITAGNIDGAFAINTSTGELIVANSSALTNPHFELTVSVSDSGLSSEAIVTIFVTDETGNSAPIASDASFTIPANSPNGTALGTLEAIDAEYDSIRYSITSGNTGSAFTIGIYGEITVAETTALDITTNPVFTLTIEVSDGILSSTSTVTVSLTDETGNSSPVVQNQSFSIPENSTNGTIVGTVSASDGEDDPLTFSITSGNTDGAFAINNTTGELTVTNDVALDFSINPQFTLMVEVNDGALSSSANVIIDLTEVVENTAPSITNQSFTLAENSANGTVLGTVAASDTDGDALTYSITAGNTSTAFAINTSTGELTVANTTALDASVNPSFNLTVQVSDGTLTASATVTVSLTDETGNTAPSITNQAFTLAENSANGTVLGTVTASDTDGDALTYSITAGNTSTAFAINTSTGELTVANTTALDASVNPSFNLTVQVSDGTLTASATVTVSLTDETGNTAPSITNQSFTLAENSANGTVLGTVAASDTDGDALTYSITAGNTSTAFAINTSTGELTVANTTALDASVNPSFNLTVQVSDGTLTASATVTVSLTDETGNTAPSITNQAFTLAENSANGTVLGTVAASDTDGDALTYSITAGNTSTAFAINTSTGELTVANTTALDASVNPSFNLTVQVSDGTLTASATVTVSLTDETGNTAPSITNQAFTLAENSANGTVLGTVAASDTDGDALTYSITAGNTSTAFAINTSTGELTVANTTALDASVNPSFNLTVQVSDGTLTASATVTVSLTDETGNTAPSITNQAFTLAENSANGTVLGTVAASDTDGDALTYSITAGNTSTAFAINTSTGELTVANTTALDASVNPSFNLTVQVSDGTLTASATVTVSLTDETGNTAPSITNQSFTLAENSANGTVLGTVAASDTEGDPLTYSITAGNTSTAFAIDASTGELTVANSDALDFEGTPVFSLTVQVNDGSLSASATTTINLEDVNENTAPEIADQAFTIEENSETATVIGTVEATDPEAQSLTFILISGNTDNAFAINSSTGELTVANTTALDFETNPVFTLVVEVTDGELSASANVTVNLTDVDENVTGISDDLNILMKVYPNPAQDYIFVESESSLDVLEISLIDLKGREVSMKAVESVVNNHRVDLKGLDAGVYVLMIKTVKGTITKRIVKD